MLVTERLLLYHHFNHHPLTSAAAIRCTFTGQSINQPISECVSTAATATDTANTTSDFCLTGQLFQKEIPH